MNYISHIPLIGGFTVAAMNVFKTPPAAITSYCPFYPNDKILLDHLEKKQVPFTYETLENGTHNLKHLFKKLDLAIAVPPCSGLSAASSLKAGARQVSPVNDWMYKSAELMMGDLKPTVYCFENAPGLFTDIGTCVRESLMNTARKHGYAATFYKTNTLLHGIPQFRPRTYAIFYKGENAPILNYIRRDSPSVAEYLKTIPKDATLQNSYACNEPKIDDYEIVKFLKIKFGNDWRTQMLSEKKHITSYDFLLRSKLIYEYRDYVKNLPNAHPASIKDVEHVIKKNEMGKNSRVSHRVLCVDKHHVYAVIGEMMERNVHPTEDRRINIREYMHLMGLPYDFDMPDDPRQYAKLTQNVPVQTSEDILNEVKELLAGNRSVSHERFLMIDNTKDITISKTKKLF